MPPSPILSLQHVAEHAGGRLEALHADVKDPTSTNTEKILGVFSEKCVKLEELDLNCGDAVLCAGRGAALLVRGCPCLQYLVVNKYSTIGDSARDLIQVIRPELTILVHNASSEYDVTAFDV